MSTAQSLGLHERYVVARRCVNSASIVAAAAILELDAHTTQPHDVDYAFQVLRSHFAQRIHHALAQYPLLGYCVHAPRSKSPQWAPIHPAPSSNGILHVGPAISVQQDRTDSNRSKLLARAVLDTLNELPLSTQLDKGPLWKVQLNQIHDAQADTPTCLVVLSTDHSINDGRGTLNLFRMLLDSTAPIHTTSVQPSIPPASDQIFNFKPSVGYMLGVAWQELVLPKLPLPSKIKSMLRGPVSWPASPSPAKRSGSSSTVGKFDIVRQPKQCEPALHIILVSAPNLVTNLKRLANAHIDPTSNTKKAATLHAIVQSLALASLYAAIAHSHNIQDPAALAHFDLVLDSATPISLRDEARSPKRKRTTLSPAVEPSSTRLPETSGNFVSSYIDSFHIRGKNTFWRLTNRFAADLASPKGRRSAKQHMGLLAYIPDFDASSNQHKSDVAYANGWEQFFGEKACSPAPFDSTFTVSNLGMVDLSHFAIPLSESVDAVDAATENGTLIDQHHSTPEKMQSDLNPSWRVKSATWAQSFTPQGEAFGVDVAGFATSSAEQCLSIAISSRPDAFRDAHLHQRFTTYLERLLLVFSDTPTKVSSQEKEVKFPLDTDPTFANIASFLFSLTPSQHE